MQLLGALLALSLVDACATNDRLIKPEDVQGLIIGTTTEPEVIQKLGDPATRSVTPGSGIFDAYNYVAPLKPSEIPSFAPLSQTYYHQSGNRQQGVLLAFGPDGTLQAVTPTYQYANSPK